jgi:Domain of unknown function (DUF4224)
MSDLFLTADEIRTLTGRGAKSRQVAQLRKMGIRFHINAGGVPVVPRAQFIGAQAPQVAPAQTAWKPKLIAA